MYDSVIGTSESQKAESAPLLLSAAMLAKRLGISMRTLWRLRSSGKLPVPVRLGGTVRWRAVEVAAWIEADCPNSREWQARRKADRSFHSR